MKDTNSLSHTSYRCKYHVVIVPKYRRMIIYNRLRKDIGEILRSLIERKPGVVMLEAEACPDHIHILLEIPPKYAISYGDSIKSRPVKQRKTSNGIM